MKIVQTSSEGAIGGACGGGAAVIFYFSLKTTRVFLSLPQLAQTPPGYEIELMILSWEKDR